LRQRNAAGEIVPNPAKFPDGMGAFSSQLKQKGVGLGIYTSHGNLTCQKFPGSWGHEEQDAQTYKKWGVVFVKKCARPWASAMIFLLPD
jgi:alpha-galactosidase